jgi:hypothetical protein
VDDANRAVRRLTSLQRLARAYFHRFIVVSICARINTSKATLVG